MRELFETTDSDDEDVHQEVQLLQHTQAGHEVDARDLLEETISNDEEIEEIPQTQQQQSEHNNTPTPNLDDGHSQQEPEPEPQLQEKRNVPTIIHNCLLYTSPSPRD